MMLKINNLTIEFQDKHGGKAARNICLSMNAGELLGLVGESGAGKSLTALAIAGLLPRKKTKATGQILFEGLDLLSVERKVLRKIQGKEIGFIFQESMTALNPLMRIGPQIEESLLLHTDMSAQERYRTAIAAMRSVELPDAEDLYHRYPHQLSGGQRQRALIASASILNPKLLIADEPTTALDVPIQIQIIKLLQRLNFEKGVGILFISHDLRIVRMLCQRVAVMRHGKIVEEGLTEDIFSRPQEPYTKTLIASIPRKGNRLA